jgi:hypothetical protein
VSGVSYFPALGPVEFAEGECVSFRCVQRGQLFAPTTHNNYLSQTPTWNVKGVTDLDKNGVPDLR